MKIDINKKYRYRNGESARILCVDAEGVYPVVSLRQSGDPVTHTEDGLYYPNSEQDGLDLIEVREPREFKIAVFTPDGTVLHLAPHENPADVYTNPEVEVIRVREIID